MKPAWEKLGAIFSSESVLIGDVDCTVEKKLCSRFGVRGYPTIKYFTDATASDGDKYEGGRDFSSLKTWADENLGPKCSPDNIELCNEKDAAAITAAQALSLDERAAYIEAKSVELEAAETYFTEETQKLQARYQDLVTDKDKIVNDLAPTLKLYRSLQQAVVPKDEL